MDGSHILETDAVFRTANVECSHPDPVAALRDALGEDAFAVVMLFVTPRCDFARIIDDAQRAFAGTEVVACTTAGEISPNGYTEGEIVAVGLPRSLFAASTLLVKDLQNIVPERVGEDLIRARSDLSRRASAMDHEFAFLTVDGLSMREDELTSALAPGLGLMPLFGGSAGDAFQFRATQIGLNGVARSDAAVLVLVRTHCPVRVFSLDHMTPTDKRMVVTKADTSRRLVQEINAEPAAEEYARLMGRHVSELDTLTFADHPVVVRFGGTHHVRAIQRATEDGDLMFFSAIGEGVVLTLARPEDMVEHLTREMGSLKQAGPLAGIIACDCFLRRVEAQQKQKGLAISQVLRSHRVVGFGTYGEQTDTKHVNQTLTGVAIYHPDS